MQSYLVSILAKELKDNFSSLDFKPFDRSLVYIPEEKNLYIVFNNKLNLIGEINPDNISIKANDVGELYLNPDILVKSTAVIPDDNSKLVTEFLGTTSTNKNTVLLVSANENSMISGNLVRYGDSFEAYHIHLSSSGNGTISGASSTSTKPSLVKITIEDQIYYGIKFLTSGNSNIHFEGFDTRQNKLFSLVNFTDDTVQIEEI